MNLVKFAMTDAAAGSWTGMLGTLLPLVLMFGLMYLLLIRPQRTKEKKLREQINAMAVGDKVITAGGVVGKVVNLKDDEVTISTSVANTLITFKKASVNTVVKPVSE
ncbi:MAG: preprotein translocase subunit YajC [Clostridia bacterium]|nr:preprotein translocase subunit YajC [Clostridia bacterium]